MTKYFNILILAVLLSCGLTACSNTYTTDIRTDPAPIYKRLPTLPQADRMYWQYYRQTGLGLDINKLYVFVFYDNAETYYDTIGQLVPAENDCMREPSFIPDELENEPVSWDAYKSGMTFQEGSDTPLSAEIYGCDEKQVVYIFIGWD